MPFAGNVPTILIQYHKYNLRRSTGPRFPLSLLGAMDHRGESNTPFCTRTMPP
jgi:hypothetical protein